MRDEDVFRGTDDSVKNFLTSVPLVADLRSPAMRDRHWEQLMDATKVKFDVNDPSFKLDDLLKLELHKFEDEVGEIVDCAQKEEKMELALAKLKETWGRVEFQFTQFKNTPVSTVKMAEEDFEALEDNQVGTHTCLMLCCVARWYWKSAPLLATWDLSRAWWQIAAAHMDKLFTCYTDKP